MPQVFSPGEAETRPLDPDAIVYTTAQKVADLLEIGPQEAVAVSNDSDSDGLSDFLNSTLVYSDNVSVQNKVARKSMKVSKSFG